MKMVCTRRNTTRDRERNILWITISLLRRTMGIIETSYGRAKFRTRWDACILLTKKGMERPVLPLKGNRMGCRVVLNMVKDFSQHSLNHHLHIRLISTSPNTSLAWRGCRNSTDCVWSRLGLERGHGNIHDPRYLWTKSSLLEAKVSPR